MLATLLKNPFHARPHCR